MKCCRISTSNSIIINFVTIITIIIIIIIIIFFFFFFVIFVIIFFIIIIILIIIFFFFVIIFIIIILIILPIFSGLLQNHTLRLKVLVNCVASKQQEDLRNTPTFDFWRLPLADGVARWASRARIAFEVKRWVRSGRFGEVWKKSCLYYVDIT